MPKSHTDYLNKIGLGADDKSFLLANHDVVLNWPYKDCVLEGKQTKESVKGEEVFTTRQSRRKKLEIYWSQKFSPTGSIIRLVIKTR